MINAVDRLSLIERKTVRKIFEARFTAKRMATDYLKVYDDVIFQQASQQLANKKTISINIATGTQNVNVAN